LTGHARMSRLVARLIPFYEFDIDDFFRSDGAPAKVAAQRQDGFFRLARLYQERYARGRQMTLQASTQISDLQFTEAYRVPFQYSRLVREHLGTGAFMQSSTGVTVTDLDGNIFYDLTGSYGVNIFGNDFYKECIASAEARAHALGPVLGPYHPVVADNVARLCAISGLDEVSFHMSGTEAVMQAVRLARYHTGRSHLVRFAGAYHGWWGDVQPGVGNPIAPHETYTLAEMSERTLRVLKTRRDIACVLVNPLQALHPNANAPADSALVDSSRAGGFDRAAYSAWLKSLRQVCTERNIVLIFDEVFVGFRLAASGAQEYFGVRADMVTYGKSLAGGLPVGVVCGRKDLMRRFREDHPVDVCFARGTFNSHPYVMTAMDEFLSRLASPNFRAVYNGLDETWNGRATRLNEMLAEHDLPPSRLRLEITEGSVMDQPERALATLQELAAVGIGLSVDDFGTGYSSLAYLQRLPVTELKIDRSFVLGLAASPSDGEIVRSTVGLGHNLGLSIVAEGVEDESSLAFLREVGCDIAQGFFIAKPMPADSIAGWATTSTWRIAVEA